MSPAAYTQRHAGVEVGAAHDAVADLETRVGEPVGGRGHPDADDDDVGRLVPAAVDQHGAGLEALDRDAAPDLDAVVGVDGRDRRPHRRAEAADQRRRRALEHQYLVAELARRGGDLEADEAGADDDHATPAAGDPFPQVERVVDRSQHDDVGQIVLSRQLARARTGGEDRTLEAQVLSAVEFDPVLGEIESDGTGRESPFDVERGDVLGLAQRDPVDLPLAAQQPLRERRPVVRHDGARRR